MGPGPQFWFASVKKTAGHQRHKFRPLGWLKLPFRIMKAFFFKKKTSGNFDNFFQFQNYSDFCKKNSGEKKNFVKYHLIRILPQIFHLQRF